MPEPWRHHQTLQAPLAIPGTSSCSCRGPGSISAPQDCESLPQQCCSMARFQLSAAFTGHGNHQARPACGSTSQSSLRPTEMPRTGEGVATAVLSWSSGMGLSVRPSFAAPGGPLSGACSWSPGSCQMPLLWPLVLQYEFSVAQSLLTWALANFSCAVTLPLNHWWCHLKEMFSAPAVHTSLPAYINYLHCAVKRDFSECLPLEQQLNFYDTFPK